MGTRLELQTLLEGILGNRNVYYQPPETVKLSYPCIIYKRNNIETVFANDRPYQNHVRYEIKLIDRNPDSAILDKLLNLPRCAYERSYTGDNLNHDVFNLYY